LPEVNLEPQGKTEQSVFLAAVEIDSVAERDEFLRRACAGDTALRLAVEALLRVHARSGDVVDRLDTTGFDPVLSEAADPQTDPIAVPEVNSDSTLGDFQLVREIGRGGMGVVYEARQISLNRRVAIKVLPFAAVLDQRQLERFRTEAQAAAGLHHGNIVPVFHIGHERAVHFYAM